MLEDNNSDVNFDLLDATLDDIDDLPEFGNYPPGAHKVLITLDPKVVNKNPCVEAAFKYVECVELSEPTKDEAPKEGAVASVLFQLNNEFGAGLFKKLATPLGAAFGTRSNREIVDQTKDIEVVMITGLRADKNDKEKFYMTIKELAVV